MNKFLSLCFSITLLCGPLAAEPKSPTDRFNLNETPSGPRFDLSKERVWPEKTGVPVVSLWSGDRYAAVSITIDDNWGPNHEWWAQITKELGLRVTWFVITDRVGTGVQWGSWDDFRELAAAGHSIQSHTVTHLNVDDNWQGIDWEYAESKKALETALPGQPILALAYPGGKNSHHNDRKAAEKVYITARGAVGTPNSADRIDYLQTNSAKISRSYVDAILEGTSDIKWLGGGKYQRAWLSAHFHGVNGEFQAETEKDLRYLKSQETDLWIAPFEEVARYGQQRDTHRLELLENNPERIRFNLTDQMRDDIYNLPLSVKIRIPDGWKGARAKQGRGEELQVEMVSHEGINYALLPVVPDRGEVTVVPGG